MHVSKMKKEDLVKEVINLRDKVAGYQATVNDLKQQAKEANAIAEEKDSAINNLKNKVAELDETLICKDKNIAERREANVQLTKELQDTRNRVISIREDAQGMESKIADLTVANAKLKVWKYIAIGAIIAFLIALCAIVA